MKAWMSVLLLFSTSLKAQDIYEMTGFAPLTAEEMNTFYEDMYRTIQKQDKCRRDYVTQMKAINKDEPSIYEKVGNYDSGEKYELAAVAECSPDKRKEASLKPVSLAINGPFHSFIGSFANEELAGFGVTNQSDMPNRFTPTPFKGVNGKMFCYGSNGPSFENNTHQHGKKFKAAHLAEINNDGKMSQELEAIAIDACKDFDKNNTAQNKQLVDVLPGFGGISVARTNKTVKTLKEALPLIQYSVARETKIGQIYVGSNFGSSNQGAGSSGDELEHDIMERYKLAYDGNRFKDFFSGKNPHVMMRGLKEGNTSSWNERSNLGSADVLLWNICIVPDGPAHKTEKPREEKPLKEVKKIKKISLVNENVSIELPDNVVSPFPLEVQDGVIKNVNLKSKVNENNFIVPDLTKNPYQYGPRNTALSDKDKKMMETAATAMTNKAKGFVDQIIQSPAQTLNLDGSKIMVSSCSNYLRNEPGYEVWQTQTPPTARNKDNRISFEELSKNRVDAQYAVLTSLVNQELKTKEKEIQGEINNLKAKKVAIEDKNNEDANKLIKEYDEALKLLESQKVKISQVDFKKIQVESVPCDLGDGFDKGVAGPNPYYDQLIKKFNIRNEWPLKPQSRNLSGYYLKVFNISKQLKKRDVESKLIETKKKLKDLTDSNKDKITAEIYLSMIDNYIKILEEKDGEPGYLNIPLISNNDSKYPCDPGKPGENIECDLSRDTSKSLDGFKVEKFMVDLEMNHEQIVPDVNPGQDQVEPPLMEPSGGKIFYAAAICTTKYRAERVRQENNRNARGRKGSRQ